MDEKELLELTRKTAETLFGAHRKGGSAYELWRQFDPELAKQLSMFYTGRMFAREVLSHRDRELCVVAALTVTGYAEELHLHCNAALNVGATAQEVAEVIFQMSLYGGAPCMIQGLKVLRQVLEERGEWKPVK
jgi:alkylhydroperoxidase/carboxymuconolactone decarboxylase family protein YurZ